MSNCSPKLTTSELVLSAVFYLQQKKGVTVMEIADFVAEKKGCNPCNMRRPVKQILSRAKEHGIMSECRGKFRIEGRYDDKVRISELKPKLTDEIDCGGSGDDIYNLAGGGDICSLLGMTNTSNGCNPEVCAEDVPGRRRELYDEGSEGDDDDDDNSSDRDTDEPTCKKRRTCAKKCAQGRRSCKGRDRKDNWACMKRRMK